MDLQDRQDKRRIGLDFRPPRFRGNDGWGGGGVKWAQQVLRHGDGYPPCFIGWWNCGFGLPGEVGECFVGFSHAVCLFACIHGFTFTTGGIPEFSCESLGHWFA